VVGQDVYMVVGQEVKLVSGPYGGTGKVRKITPSCIEVDFFGSIYHFNRDGLGLDGEGPWEMGGEPYILDGSKAALSKGQTLEDFCKAWDDEIEHLGHRPLTPEEHQKLYDRWYAEHPRLIGWDGKDDGHK
jgi:hypothetical protein